MTTKTMGGLLAVLLLVGCGDATTSDSESGPAAAANANGGNESAATSPSEPIQTSQPGQTTPSEPSQPSEPAQPALPTPPSQPAPADCSVRTGGALITFNKGSESWTVWSTNEKFNSEAMLAALKGTAVQPVFHDVIDGVDCDGQFTWHVDPESTGLDADYEASCDALPSEVEAKKADFLKMNKWCPSKVLVASYQAQ
jgi:hypothetical protein